MDVISIRSLQPADNFAIASTVRGALTEYGAAKPGTAYYDKATDDMYASFQLPGSHYYVGLIDDQIAGGGGIYPSPGLPENVCELVKMYLNPTAREETVRGNGRY